MYTRSTSGSDELVPGLSIYRMGTAKSTVSDRTRVKYILRLDFTSDGLPRGQG